MEKIYPMKILRRTQSSTVDFHSSLSFIRNQQQSTRLTQFAQTGPQDNPALIYKTKIHSRTFSRIQRVQRNLPSLRKEDPHNHISSAPLFNNHTFVICTTWRPRREWARTSIDGLASCHTAPSWIAGLEQEGRRAPVHERERNDGP